MENKIAVEDAARSYLSNADIEALREDFARVRKERRLTQKEVALKLGVSQPTLSAFEKEPNQEKPETRLRKRTLDGIVRLHQIWIRDADKIVDGGFPSHGEAPNQAQRQLEHQMPVACPHCAKPMTGPARFCSDCGKALGIKCACEHVVTDEDANFCPRCGRDLWPDALSILPHPKYDKPDEVKRMKYLRAYLKATDEESESALGLETNQRGEGEQMWRLKEP